MATGSSPFVLYCFCYIVTLNKTILRSGVHAMFNHTVVAKLQYIDYYVEIQDAIMYKLN